MTRFMLLAYLLLKKLFIHSWNFVNDLHFALNMLTIFTQFFFFCLPLKISKSLWFSELSRNDKKRTLRRNGFNYSALKTIANQKLQGNLQNLMVIELRRISHNTGFLWPVFSRKRTESSIQEKMGQRKPLFSYSLDSALTTFSWRNKLLFEFLIYFIG